MSPVSVYHAGDTPALFALGSSRAYGERVARRLGTSLLAHEERRFPDGERKCRPLQSVRGRRVTVLHSLYGESGESVHDKLCQLLFFIGALRDADALEVTAVLPYLAYARKDQKSKPRDPVATRYLAAMLEAVGVDRVITLDVHNRAAFQNAFRCRTELLSGAPLLLGAMLTRLGPESLCVLAPDAGAFKRAEAFRQSLQRVSGRDASLAFVEKYRSEDVLSGGRLAGDVAKRHVLLLDDMISTGGTVLRALAACEEAHARRVTVLATHGLLLAGSQDMVAHPLMQQALMCDTVSPAQNLPPHLQKKILWVDSSPLVAEAIARLDEGGSLVELASRDCWPPATPDETIESGAGE